MKNALATCVLGMGALLAAHTGHAAPPADVITVGSEGIENDCTVDTIKDAVRIVAERHGPNRNLLREHMHFAANHPRRQTDAHVVPGGMWDGGIP